MLLNYIVIAATALGGSLGLTAALIRFSERLRLIAKPRADRWHSVPTANTGGVAIVLSVVLAYGLANTHRYDLIAALSVLIALLGFFDDRLQLRPAAKFLGQSVIILCVIAAGIKLPLTNIPALDAAITFLWIAGITNAFNLIDNMDGL